MSPGARASATLLALVLATPSSLVAQDAGVPDAGVGPDAGSSADAGPAPDAPPPSRTAPTLVDAPAVTLPEGAEPLPPETTVGLLITIAIDGTVSEVVLEEPIRPDVDEAVLAAARQMRFTPATRDGTPVPSRIRFRYRVAPAPVEPPPPVESEGGPEGEGGTEGEGTAEGEGAPAEGETPPEGEADEASEAEEGPPAELGVEAVADRPEPGAATRITLTGAELTNVPGTFGEPLRVVQFLPGVGRTPFNLPFFIVRGANFQNTGSFIDGFPVPILFHFGAGPAVISSRLVERQRFYPGGYPVSLGRYSAGVITLETAAPEAESLHLEAEVDLLRASLLGIVPFRDDRGGRGTVVAAFRRSYYELLVPLFVQGLEISYTDYQLRFDYRFDDRLTISLFAFGSDDSLDQSGALMGGTTSGGTNTSVGYEFQRAILTLDWRMPGDSRLRIAGMVGRDVTAFGSRAAGTAEQRFVFQSILLGLRADLSAPVAPWLTLNAGIDALGQGFTVDVTAPTPTGLGEYPRPLFDPQLVNINANVARGLPSAYAETAFDFDPVEISLGLRADLLRYGAITDVAFDPRAVGRWHIIPEVTLKLATGIFNQPPAVFQTIASGGNPRLPPQRAWQSSLGLELDLPLDIDIEVTGFYSQMWDIARFSQTVVVGDDGRPNREFFRADQEGRAWGLEVLVRRPIEGDGFFAWLSYTLSRSERLNAGGNWEPFSFDQTHILNLVASYQIDGWRFGATFQLATGRPSLTVCGATFDADAVEYNPEFCDTGNRLPVYHQLNVRIDRDFNIDNVVTGAIYLDVLNVYYAQNAEGVIYQYDFARSTPLPGLPILGTLGIRAAYE